MQVPFVAVERQLIQIILVFVMLPSYYFSLASSPWSCLEVLPKSPQDKQSWKTKFLFGKEIFSNLQSMH